MIDDLELSLSAAALRIDLEAASARRQHAERPEQRAIRVPRLSPPGRLPSMALDLRPALDDLLRQLDQGHVRVLYALPRRELRRGPFRLDLRAGHHATLDLKLRHGVIQTRQTRGVIEPPLRLPFGVRLSGAYLDAAGDLHLALDPLPDLNLSRWSRGRVPALPLTLPELARALLELPRPPRSQPGLDWSALDIRASGLRPRHAIPLALGRDASLTLGPETRLDLELRGGALTLSGGLSVADAELRGPVSARGLRGKARLDLRLPLTERPRGSDISLHVMGLDATLDALDVTAPDLRLKLERVGLSDAHISLRRDAQEETAGLALHAPRFEGRLTEGVVTARVDGRPIEARLTGALEGELSLGPETLAGTFRASELTLSVPERHALELGPMHLVTSSLEARGAGQLRIESGAPLRFEGALETSLEVGGTALSLPGLRAELKSPSRATLTLRRLALAPGLLGFDASALVRVELGRGELPLGPTTLRFGEGARGALRVTRLEKTPGVRWPSATAELELSAEATAGRVGTLSAEAALSARIEPEGALQLSGMRARVASPPSRGGHRAET